MFLGKSISHTQEPPNTEVVDSDTPSPNISLIIEYIMDISYQENLIDLSQLCNNLSSIRTNLSQRKLQ